MKNILLCWGPVKVRYNFAFGWGLTLIYRQIEFLGEGGVDRRLKLIWGVWITLQFDVIFLVGYGAGSILTLNRIFKLWMSWVPTEIILSCSDRIAFRWNFFFRVLVRFGLALNRILISGLVVCRWKLFCCVRIELRVNFEWSFSSLVGFHIHRKYFLVFVSGCFSTFFLLYDVLVRFRLYFKWKWFGLSDDWD